MEINMNLKDELKKMVREVVAEEMEVIYGSRVDDKVDDDAHKTDYPVEDEKKIIETALFPADKNEFDGEKLRKALKVPFANVQLSTLGGAQNAAVMVMLSLDPKEKWANGIFQNSRYMGFHLSLNGTMEQFSLTHTLRGKKFRKTRVKSMDEFVDKINKYVAIVSKG
jgi:RNA-splicing ligase RtcB